MADLNAQELIKAALRAIGAIAVGETPDNSELADGLEAMKIMFRQWAADGLNIYTSGIDTHTLTAGTTSYTIGSGATINTTRPQLIKAAYVTYGGIDYQLTIIGEAEYSRIYDKDSNRDYASALWYKPTYPNGTIYLWPPGGGTLTLHSVKQLTEPTAFTSDVQFPGEYDAAIKWNLAEQLCPEYGKEPSPYIMMKAEQAMNDVKNLNLANDMNAVRTDIIRISRRYHIDTD